MKKSRAVALIAVALVAGLALGSVGVSYAATDNTTDPATCGLGGRMGLAMRDAGGRLIDIVADLTGLTVEEVRDARVEGESIADIAEANGVDAQEVVDAALDARKEALDAKVADGTITQEQADAAYERMAERLSERVTSDELGCGAGGQGRGQGMMGGQGRGQGMMGGQGFGPGACGGAGASQQI